MHCALAARPRAFQRATRDVDLYLTVARSLLAGAKVASVLGTDAEVAPAFCHRKAGRAGRDFPVWSPAQRRLCAYQPRGHYDGKLAQYFKP